MAKKKTVRKKAGGSKTGSRSRAASSSAKTAAKKKTTAKKASSKKKKKSPSKKAATKKKTKKTAKKAPAKKVAKKVAKKAGKPAAAKTPAKKTTTKKAAAGRSRKKKTSLGARSVAEAASEGKADAQGYVFINGRRVRMITSVATTPTKKSRSTAAVVVESIPEVDAKPIKTKLTAKELRHYRDLLLRKRADLVGDVSAMEEAALNASGGNLSNLPIHMADIGSDTYDQDFMLSLAEKERKHLYEIDDALMRIENKTYGVCQMTGKPIPAARLNAKPWAKYTIESARKLEGQWRA